MIRTGGVGVGQVLADGRSIVGVVGVDGSHRVLRLAVDGSIDSTFNPPSFGTIVPSISFTPVLTDPVKNDTRQFNLSTYGGNGLLRAAHQTADGKVYVGGRFALAGSPRGLVRLSAMARSTHLRRRRHRLQPGRRRSLCDVDHLRQSRPHLRRGRFDSFNGHAVPAGLFRLHADGSFDAGWVSPISIVDAPRAEGGLVVVGAKLYVFGTVAVAGDTLPAPYRVADIPPPPAIITAPQSQAVARGSLSPSMSSRAALRRLRISGSRTEIRLAARRARPTSWPAPGRERGQCRSLQRRRDQHDRQRHLGRGHRHGCRRRNIGDARRGGQAVMSPAAPSPSRTPSRSPTRPRRWAGRSCYPRAGVSPPTGRRRRRQAAGRAD